MKHTTIAVDIAKNVFEIAVSFQAGRVDEYHRVTRAKFLSFFAARESATVVMGGLRFGTSLGAGSRGAPSSRRAATPSRGTSLRPTEQTRPKRTQRGYWKRIETKTSNPSR